MHVADRPARVVRERVHGLDRHHLMRNGSSDAVRPAATALLNRGRGLPRQSVEESLSINPVHLEPVSQMPVAELVAELDQIRAEKSKRILRSSRSQSR